MKKIMFALLAVLLVVVIGIAALLALVDPNQFKPMIAEQVKKNTGRELIISGDIGWRFFPSIGFDIGKTEFRNPEGFAEPNLVQFDSAELSVSVIPLFSQQLEIGNVSLQGGHVFIQTLASGVTNLDGIGQPSEVTEFSPQPDTTTSTPSSTSDTESGSSWAISLESVEVVGASAIVQDDKLGTKSELSQLNFSLSRFAPGEWATAQFDIAGASGELNFAAQGETELMFAETLDSAEFKTLALTASAKDTANDIQSVSLNVDQFKLGSWSNVTFTLQGSVPDLAFNTNGSVRLSVDEAFENIQLEQLALTSDLKGASLPRPEMAIKLVADASYNVPKGLAAFTNMETNVDELALTGKGSFQSADIPVIRFDLASDAIDVDRFLGTGASTTQETQVSTSGDSTNTAGATASEADKNREPDLSALKTIDLAGTLAVGQFKAANAKLSDVAINIAIADGVLNLKQLDAKLYDGTIQTKATIDANGKLPRYSVTKLIRGVQVQPLLIDVAEKDVLAGKGDITVKLSGTGLAEARMRENIAGSIDIHFADGAVYGVNLPEMIREARATLKGQKTEYVKEEKKTDFSAMKATFNIGKGVASTNNLDIDSPLLRVAGKGSTNLVSEAIDFNISASVVATSKGQGGKDIDEVTDLTVPIDVAGNWEQPTFSLNLAQLLKQNNELEQKAQKEVERGLEKLLGDKAQNEDIKKAADKLLKGLFN
ncbi:AsmA family protein [Photobacterium minamisatsumaniensis]|uniref:AsmA family protein n=1 Tax=Photobacterium minamisatsumaniensis TaxID=2910233 RepID=UPI003D150A9F